MSLSASIFASPMPSLTLPFTWSSLPLHSVDLSPPSLPASSLTLPLASSNLPSVLSCMSCLLVFATGQRRARPVPLTARYGGLAVGGETGRADLAKNPGAHQLARPS